MKPKHEFGKKEAQQLVNMWEKSKKYKRYQEMMVEVMSAELQIAKINKRITRRMAMAIQAKLSAKIEEIANKYSKYLDLEDESVSTHQARVLSSRYKDVISDELWKLKEMMREEFGDEQFQQNLNKLKDLMKV